MIEVGLFACVLATMFGFVRVFGDHGYMGRLSVVALVASVLASLLRRRGVGAALSVVIHTVLGVIVIANLYLSEYTTNGLPTRRTLGVAYSLIVDESAQLRLAVPPIAATTGLMVLLAALMWALTLFADSAALRVHAPAQAVAPLVVIFIAVGVSQPGFDRLVSVIVFGAAIGCYALIIGHLHDQRLPWIGDPSTARTATTRLGRSAFGMSIVVLLALTAAAAIPPDSEPVLALRNKNDNPGREVVSPFVSIRALLGARSDVAMFRVESSLPSYWRLTALDTYDISRDIWISTGQYRKVGRALPTSTDASVTTTGADQHFEMLGLGGPWIPTIFEAEQYRGEPTATFNTETSTLFADEDLTDGQTYDVVSAVPDFAVADLARAGRPTFDEFDERLLKVPAESNVERQFLDWITAGEDGPYDTLIELQNTFRSKFVYSEDVDYSDSPDPIAAFLTERSGFCQQFSSVFALMARRMGLPSRVAVGFTMGDTEDSEDPEGSGATGSGRGGQDERDHGTNGTFLVRGRHAHAWPEVYFQDLGWVAFEPTPGRGNPATVSYTGVAAAQVEPAPEPEPSSVTTPVTSPEDDPTATTMPPDTVPPPDTSGASLGSSSTDEQNDRTPLMLIIGAALLLAAATATVVVVRRRRRQDTDSPADPDMDPRSRRLIGSWTRALRSLRDLGIRHIPTETPTEFAKRVADQLGSTDPSPAGPAGVIASGIYELAATETLRRYSGLFDESPAAEPELIADLVERSERTATALVEAVSALTADGVDGPHSRPTRDGVGVS